MPATTSINPTEPPRSVTVLLLKITGLDETYESRTRACGYDWVINYFPGVWHSGDYWVMLRITLASDSNGLVTRFSGSLVGHGDHDGGLLGRLDLPPVTAELSRGQAKDFFVMSRPELFRSGYVHDDSFLLELEISVVMAGDNPKEATPAVANAGNAATAAPSSSDMHKHFGEITVVQLDDKRKGVTAVANSGNASTAVPSSDLHKHFGELWRSQRGTDVTFLVAGEPIAAHRCVLAARSPVFMAKLFGDMKETASQSVVVEDMEPDVFRALMQFIYTDTSPEVDGEDEHAKAMAQHLLAAADRYGMERLKLICEEKMCGDVNVATAAAHLVLAEQHGCSKLKARCMEFMVATPANLRAVVATEGYKHLMASCPSLLSDLLVSVVQRYK